MLFVALLYRRLDGSKVFYFIEFFLSHGASSVVVERHARWIKRRLFQRRRSWIHTYSLGQPKANDAALLGVSLQPVRTRPMSRPTARRHYRSLPCGIRGGYC